MSTDQTPALTRAAEALNRAQEVDGPEDMTLAEKAARIAVAAALHDPDDVIARTIGEHERQWGFHGAWYGYKCRCGALTGRGREDHDRHVADAVRVEILGSEVA